MPNIINTNIITPQLDKYPTLDELSFVKGATSNIQEQLDDLANGGGGGVTTGNLTESTSSVLNIVGGTNAVVGSGTSIQVKQASASLNGYLSSTDWNTFNNKQDALNSGVNIKTINSNSLVGSGNVAVQDVLVSGTNIKTINTNSLLGSGNISVQDTLVSGTNIKTINSGSILGSGDLLLQDKLVSGTNIKTINSTSLLGSGDLQTLGYTLSVQALTSSPADGQTIYFGNLPKAPTTTANISKVYIRKAGTIKVAEIYCYSGTAGTNESWSMYIRKNNLTDTLIATLGVNTNERVFTNTALSIAVAIGDYIEIKCINPTWATNPLTTIFGGYIYIE